MEMRNIESHGEWRKVWSERSEKIVRRLRKVAEARYGEADREGDSWMGQNRFCNVCT